MKNTLHAVHRDGRKLYLPQWDSAGEIIPSKLPTAAVTVTSEGVTFPPGSIWIRRPRSSGLQDGWKLAEDEKPARKVRAPNTSYLNRLASKPAL